MNSLFLKNILNNINYKTLPSNWSSFDLEKFSKNKRLWVFQQNALENCLKLLKVYYEDIKDYENNELSDVNLKRKEALFNWYKNHGLEENLDIKLDQKSKKIIKLLDDYYTIEEGKISYHNFINRMSFWMATGSGKTLVIIKLIEILKILMQRGEIPKNNILFLTHRDDLIEQFKRMVYEFNEGSCEKIELKELKEYPGVKRTPRLFGFPVFYYRSDNISDEQKEKIIDFKAYDDEGRWYILLDEAHKGDKEDAKRQHIYSIMSRNGFLFNFSATFVDQRDKITTAYEFNLASFIKSGYGKHISVLKQEIRAFRENEDYTDYEKQKIVMKSLILLTYIKKYYERVSKINPSYYHKPLLLVLVNSINDEIADLRMFFIEVEKIAKGEVDEKILSEAKSELWEEMKNGLSYVFEDSACIKFNKNLLLGISIKEILLYIFNAESFGEIEISYRPSDKKQVAFKLATSERHFALSKTGNIPKWLQDEFSRFNVNHTYEEEGFFERINSDDSSINILMGSRAFYEGWDSNRPNVINFINIGGPEARKFVLQSIGRGVRIEPISGARKRLVNLKDENVINQSLYDCLKEFVDPLETLFIFGTNREAIKEIIEDLNEQQKEIFRNVELYLNRTEVRPDRQLYIPVYKIKKQPIFLEKDIPKFEISERDLQLLENYLNYISDDRLLLMKYSDILYDDPIGKIRILRDSLKEKEKYYKVGLNKYYKDIDILIIRLLNYFYIYPEKLKEIKQLGDEISHYKKVKVSFEDIQSFKEKIDKIKEYPTEITKIKKLYGKIPAEEYEKKIRQIKEEEFVEYNGKTIKIKYIKNHYYVPIILTEDERSDYIQHIIKTPSEISFIRKLEEHISSKNNRLSKCDWWMFSKLEQSIDEVFIPYYDPDSNKMNKFHPDFIFWIKQRLRYLIIFIDPHGKEHIEYQHKIAGYKRIFEENGEVKEFQITKGLRLSVFLFFETDDVNKLPDNEIRKYWFDDLNKLFDRVLG